MFAFPQIRKITVLPMGAPGPIDIRLTDHNEEERATYWEQQLRRRDEAGDWDAGMETDEDFDEYDMLRSYMRMTPVAPATFPAADAGTAAQRQCFSVVTVGGRRSLI
jgi:hypothetical protein